MTNNAISTLIYKKFIIVFIVISRIHIITSCVYYWSRLSAWLVQHLTPHKDNSFCWASVADDTTVSVPLVNANWYYGWTQVYTHSAIASSIAGVFTEIPPVIETTRGVLLNEIFIVVNKQDIKINNKHKLNTIFIFYCALQTALNWDTPVHNKLFVKQALTFRFIWQVCASAISLAIGKSCFSWSTESIITCTCLNYICSISFNCWKQLLLKSYEC